MKAGLRIAFHVVLALVAVVIFYVGLFVGLQVNTTMGTVLWFVSGALFVGNLLWLIKFLNQRREAAQR
jgi:membrane-associated PAP2 superfamily phosphatase